MSEPGSTAAAPTGPHESTTSPAGWGAAARAFGLVFLGALLVHGAFQLALPGLADRDGWFHARFAALLGSGGTAWTGLEFPWTIASAFGDHPMDWSFAWHWLLAPFTSAFEPSTGLRVLTALQAAFLTAVFHALLRAHGVRGALPWTIILVGANPYWLLRTHMGRPTPLVIALLLIVLHLAVTERVRLAALAACLSLLVYQVPAPLGLVCAAVCIGLLVERRRVPVRVAVALLIGSLVGVLLHPGLWSVQGPWPGGSATLHVWDLMSQSLGAAAVGGVATAADGATITVPLPRELAAPGWNGIARELWAALAGTLVAVGLVIGRDWKARRLSALTIAVTLVAVAGLLGTLRSGRFFEYWHPFAILAAAVTVSGAAARGPARLHAQVIGALAAVVLLANVSRLHWVISERPPDAGAEVVAGLEVVRARADAGDVVFHSSWDHFAPLFYHAPELRYITGMDPWYLVAHDLDLAFEFVWANNGQLTESALRTTLTERFGARFVLLWQPPDRNGRRASFPPLAAQLDDAPWAERIYTGPEAIAFEIR